MTAGRVGRAGLRTRWRQRTRGEDRQVGDDTPTPLDASVPRPKAWADEATALLLAWQSTPTPRAGVRSACLWSGIRTVVGNRVLGRPAGRGRARLLG